MEIHLANNNNKYYMPTGLSISRLVASPLVLISAPSGYGKTALARHLYDKYTHRKYWCSLTDPSHPWILLQQLLDCFEIASDKFDYQDFDIAFSKVIQEIIHNIDPDSQPLWVVDNFDRVVNGPCWELLTYLLIQFSLLGKLVVVSDRSNAQSAFRWADTLSATVVDERQLAFVQACKSQQLDPLFAWPYLYCAYKNDSTESVEGLKEKAFTAFDQRIYRYLSDAEKTTLTAAIVSRSFDAEYIVATTQDLNSPHQLKRLLQLGLVEKCRDSFRVNNIFSECIQNEFQFLNWQQQQSIKQRAIKYWTGKKQFEEALDFCQKDQLWTEASEVLLLCAEEYVNLGQFEGLHKWFEMLPANCIDHDPLLMVYRVWSFPEYQKIKGADFYLQQVAALLESDTSQFDPQKVLKAKVQLSALKGYIARISGDYQQAVEYSQDAVALASEGYPAILSRLYTTIGQDLYLKGDVVAAKASLGQALMLGKQYKKHHDVLISLGYTIVSMSLTCSFQKAIVLYEETLEWFKESGFLMTEAGAVINDVLIDIYREMFQLDKAQALSDSMVDFSEKNPPALYHLVTYLRRYRIAMLVEDVEQVYLALTEAEAYRELLGVSWAFGWAPVAALRAEYELRFGDLSAADGYFLEREKFLLADKGFHNEAERLIYASWLELKERLAEAKEQLNFIHDQALKGRRLLHAIKANIQLALLLSDTDPVESLLHLRDALKLVPENEQIIAPFLSYGSRVLPLLDQVSTKLYQDIPSQQLLSKIKQAAANLWPTKASSNLLDALSERQLAILKLLVEGDQDKVIAKKLDISPGTVKTHLRAIYRKLECNNRAQAVSIALENGLYLLAQSH
ncbi:MAG: LuxR C-terminal-related transcriptional regulator [Pseudomonadales bacterium]|nr:LuxR C-terminal-related transcriptional regulator [Pseudomonadales bacterium]